MKVDTGKAKVSQYNETDNIVLVDIYTDGELLISDLDKIHKAISQFNLQIPVDTICVKSGNNTLSEEAVEYSMKHNCIHDKVIYVIKHMADIHFPSEAHKTYFNSHMVDYCTSVDEAYHLLMNNPHGSVKN